MRGASFAAAIAALFVAVPLSGPAIAQAPARFSVPFHAGSDGLVLLDAELDGIRAVRTLLDTGDAAPYAVLIGPALSARAGLQPTGGHRTSRAEIGSVPAAFRSVAVGSFRLGAIRLERPSAADSPAVETASGASGRRFEAVIGGVFLRDHRVSIDYVHARVTFDGAVPTTAAVRFVTAPGRPAVIVRATVNGAGPFALVLDTGATVTILSTSTARRAGLRLGRPVALYGGGGRARGVRSLAREIRVGSARRSGARVVVADVLGPANAEAGTALEGVLGAPFFAGRRLTIDYPRGVLWIE